MAGLFTAWDVWVRHEEFHAGKLVLRLVVFSVAALLLTLLFRRVQARQA